MRAFLLQLVSDSFLQPSRADPCGSISRKPTRRNVKERQYLNFCCNFYLESIFRPPNVACLTLLMTTLNSNSASCLWSRVDRRQPHRWIGEVNIENTLDWKLGFSSWMVDVFLLKRRQYQQFKKSTAENLLVIVIAQKLLKVQWSFISKVLNRIHGFKKKKKKKKNPWILLRITDRILC